MVRRAVAIPPFVLKRQETMEYRIIWRNTATKEVFTQTAEDTGGRMYYTFPVPEGLTQGEYEYFIIPALGDLELNENDVRKSTLDGEPLPIRDCGVAQVGEIKRKEATTYNTNKTYEQYNGQE